MSGLENPLWTLILGWGILFIASFDRLATPAKLSSEARDIYDEVFPVCMRQSNLLAKAFFPYIFTLTAIYILGCIVLDTIHDVATSAGSTPATLETEGDAASQQGNNANESFCDFLPDWGSGSCQELVSFFSNLSFDPLSSIDPSVPLVVCLTLLGFGVNWRVLNLGDYYARKIAHRAVGLPDAIRFLTKRIAQADLFVENEKVDKNSRISVEALYARYARSDVELATFSEAYQGLNYTQKRKIFSIMALYDMLDDGLMSKQTWVPSEGKIFFAKIWADVSVFFRRVLINLQREDVRDGLSESQVDSVLEKLAFILAFDIHRARQTDPRSLEMLPVIFRFSLVERKTTSLPFFFIGLVSVAVSFLTMLLFVVLCELFGFFDRGDREFFFWGYSAFLTYFFSLISVFLFTPNSLNESLKIGDLDVEKFSKVFIAGTVGSIFGFYFFDVTRKLFNSEPSLSLAPTEDFYKMLVFSFVGGLAALVPIICRARQSSTFLSFLGKTARVSFFSFVCFLMLGATLFLAYLLFFGQGNLHHHLPAIFGVGVLIGLQGATLAIWFRIFQDMEWLRPPQTVESA